MTLDPILHSSLLIQIHTLAACLAFVLGPVVILRKRRDRTHRLLGYGWVSAMAITATSALGIFELRLFGPFSPIHGLSLFVAFMLWRAVQAIRAGQVVKHGRIMVQVYIGSMGIAGLFTLLPRRRMHAVLLDGYGWPGFWFAAVIFALGAAYLWSARPRYDPGDTAHFTLFKPRSNR